MATVRVNSIVWPALQWIELASILLPIDTIIVFKYSIHPVDSCVHSVRRALLTVNSIIHGVLRRMHWASSMFATKKTIVYRWAGRATNADTTEIHHLPFVRQVFQSDGSFIGKFGTCGKGEGNLEHPHYIAVSNTNRVIVSDSNNHRIQIFDVNGRVLSSFGTEGSEEGQFKFPRYKIQIKLHCTTFARHNYNFNLFHPEWLLCFSTQRCWGRRPRFYLCSRFGQQSGTNFSPRRQFLACFRLLGIRRCRVQGSWRCCHYVEWQYFSLRPRKSSGSSLLNALVVWAYSFLITDVPSNALRSIFVILRMKKKILINKFLPSFSCNFHRCYTNKMECCRKMRRYFLELIFFFIFEWLTQQNSFFNSQT